MRKRMMKKSAHKCDMVKVFSVSSGRVYAYDGRTNRIMTVSDSLVRPTLKETRQALYAYLKEKHHLPDKPLNEVIWEHSFEEYLAYIQTHIPTLLLQLTCRCNLDCDYCVYSGNYAHMMPHANADMPFETIRRSIDFFAQHNADCEKVMVDLYGGEVLMCMERLQYAVAYSRERMKGRQLSFRLTSNGVLLGREAAQWLEKNPDVRVNVTVNGPFHDLHRKMLSGQGSLERIMSNLRMIRAEFPNVWEKQIRFLSNIARPEHLKALAKFFHSELQRAPDIITHIREQDGNEKIDAILRGEGSKNPRFDPARAYLASFDPVLEGYFGNRMRAIHNRILYRKNDPGVIGSCFPIMDKLFVHYDGQFGLCETACDKLILGDLENGFDEEKLRELYEKSKELYNRSCAGCWAQRRCTVCFKDILNPDGSVADRIPESFCHASKEDALQSLRVYAEIAERDPARLDAFVTNE